ncbi:MAG TPA: thiamine phosphate synthase [Polyangiaceae bacterium]|nr:thiamine phosphate synthase [Polyangiaceae bacterium]
MSAVDALRLLVVSDAARFGERTVLNRWQLLAHAAEPGTLAIDLREHELSARALLSLGERLAEIARAARQLLVVNDRLDLALLLGADGIHLREASVETSRARALLPGAFVIRACHRQELVSKVECDIVLLSPILAERKGNPALGIEGVSAAAAHLAARVGGPRLFALGGIDAAGASDCLAAGAAGVAAISSVFEAQDPLPMLRALGVLRS